jgi:hypothetical protein
MREPQDFPECRMTDHEAEPLPIAAMAACDPLEFRR